MSALALVIADLEHDWELMKREGRNAHQKGKYLKAHRCAQSASMLRKTIEKKRAELANQQKGSK